MIKKLKRIFSKEKKNEEVRMCRNNSIINRNNKKIEISKQNIYDFFIKEGIDSTQRGTKICEYFGINPTLDFELSQTFFKEFISGDNKILITNPGEDIMSGDFYQNLFALTKESKREIKLNLILN